MVLVILYFLGFCFALWVGCFEYGYLWILLGVCVLGGFARCLGWVLVVCFLCVCVSCVFVVFAW